MIKATRRFCRRPSALSLSTAGLERRQPVQWCTIGAVRRDALQCRALNPRIPLSVNISGASLAMTGFAQRVCRLFDSLALPKDCLLLELTETSALPDVEAVSDTVRHLGEYGIRLSLDDFGTGYSGLAVLALQPVLPVVTS